METTPAVPNKPAPAKKKHKIKRKHIKWFVLGGIVLIIGILIATCSSQVKQAMNTIAFDETTVLEQADMQNSISATGIVESAQSQNVYSTMSYPVAEILVDVGDAVHEGDPLCQLDKKSIEKQIKEKELTMTATQRANAQQIKTARDNYNNYKEGIQQGTNASLISADSSVQNAYDAWQKAQRAYDDYYAALRKGQNTALLAQANSLDAAEDALDAAQSAYDSAKKKLQQALSALSAGGDNSSAIANAEAEVLRCEVDRDAAQAAYDRLLNQVASPTDLKVELTSAKAELDKAQENLTKAQATLSALQQQASPALQAAVDAAKAELSAAETALDRAEDSYDTAERSYKAALRNADSTLEEYAHSVESACQAYETALKNAESTSVNVENQLESYENSLATAQIAGNMDTAEYQLAKLYMDLEDATIKAPSSGTVTAVFATVGGTGSGLLFVIEDTANLVVETSVKSYDIGTVTEGMPVVIKSDATGEEEYEGRVQSIAPTSNKNAQGETDTTTDAVFATDVAVVSQNTGLRIGMSVRLNYIVEESFSVLAVPYDAVYQNEAGQDCVLILTQGSAPEKFLVQELPVTLGMENDLDIVISGEGVAPGLRVVNEADAYLYLQGTEITLAQQSLRSMTGANMMTIG